MKSSCIEGCLDDIVERPRPVPVPVPVPGLINYGRLDQLHRWAEEDKEFLRNMVVSNKSSRTKQPSVAERSEIQLLLYYPNSPEIIIPLASPGRDYACRQRYLRSYTFQKQKQSGAQRTKSCNSSVRAVFAVFFGCMVKVDGRN